MKRQRAKQLKDVFIAYAEGKTIQFYSKHYGKWIDLDEVNFCEDTEYRVKPEQKESKKWVDNYEEYQNACYHNKTYRTSNGLNAIER